MGALSKPGKPCLTRVAMGLTIGLFAARIVAEATRMAWSPPALVASVVASCAAFVWLARWLDRRGASLPLAPWLAFLVYIFWPQRDWSVALVAIAIALFSWLISASSRNTQHASRITFDVSRFTLIDALTFIIALGLYSATLQKDVLPADSGEFQLTVTTLVGVLHQPGYPLYTLVGKLFTLLPFGAPALRLNWMSALLAAGTLTLVGATVRRMLGDPQSCHSEPRTPSRGQVGEESLSREAETLRCPCPPLRGGGPLGVAQSLPCDRRKSSEGVTELNNPDRFPVRRVRD